MSREEMFRQAVRPDQPAASRDSALDFLERERSQMNAEEQARVKYATTDTRRRTLRALQHKYQ